MIPTITIGIPVKNEENTISDTLHALLKAVSKLPPTVKYETIVCLNGTTDNTEKIIKSDPELCQELNLTVIKSQPGKLVAERKIAKARTLDGFILFCDADTIIDTNAVKQLYNRMKLDERLRVVCAKVLPIFPRKLNNFQRMMKAYYEMRYLLPDRGCFHGRMFMVRDDKDILENYHISTRLKNIPAATIKKLYLDQGPICDDIVLSAAIVHTHGQQSVARVHNAKVYFYPPDNLYDFFLGVRRYTIELERINTLFPEFVPIHNMPRFLRPTNIQKRTIHIRKKHLAELLMEQEAFLSQLVRDYELNNKKLALWETVKSSKYKK